MSDPDQGPYDPYDPRNEARPEPPTGSDSPYGDTTPSPPEQNPYGQAPPPPPPPPSQPGGYGQPGPYGPPGYGPAPGYQPGYQAGYQPVAGGPAGHLTPDERTWGGAAHWSSLIASLLGLSFLGPLVVMLTKGNESAYTRAQAVESLNFQLSMLIYFIVSFVLVFVLVGFLLLPIVGITWLVLTIVGSVKAANGELYRYPLNIRMVS